MNKAWHSIHPNFRLNGQGHSFDSLRNVATNLVKNGESFEHEIGTFLLEWFNDDHSVQVSTSGTTGRPKPIALQKEHMINSARATGLFLSLSPGQKALLCLPAKYISGKMMLVRAMVLGLELDYVEPSSNPLHESDKHYDFAAMVPLQVQNAIYKIENIKSLLIGGAKLPKALYAALKPKAMSIFETYGMTETATHIALKEISNRFSEYFETLPDIEIASDDRGCLVITAPYLGVHEMHTNDLVEIRSATSFQLLGRYDNIINSGGVKLIPEQIESKLAKIIGNRFFVIGVQDEKLGEKLVLIVEGKTDKKVLFEALRSMKGLTKYEMPKEIFDVKNFTQTKSGKIQRKKTLQLLNLP